MCANAPVICLEEVYAHDSKEKLLGLYLFTVCRLRNVSIPVGPSRNGRNSLAFSHWL